MDLVIGIFGIIWYFGSVQMIGFPNRKSEILAGIALISTALMFIVELRANFSSLSAASSIDIFSFVGCILGIFGCANAIFRRFK